jgi:hypothetical protein
VKEQMISDDEDAIICKNTAMVCFSVSLFCSLLSQDNFCHLLSASPVTRPRYEPATLGRDPKILELNRWTKKGTGSEIK